jgi:effector-binding domain-containing protein
MGSELRLRRVRLDPPDAHHTWDFPNGVTVIVGASGGGKTQLLNLSRTGFGLDVTLVKEVKQAAGAVTLDVEIHGFPMQLTRRFSQNAVDVSVGDDPARTFSLNPSHKTLPLLGDWLLERLGIPVVRVGASRKDKSNRTTRISFEDVFAYCDLEQEEIDRSTVYDRDNFRNIKRASTFELLLGEVYEFVQGRPELATGDGDGRWQNVMLYKDQRPDVEVGVLVSARFQAQGSVIPSALPAGEVVIATHRGDYSKLGVTHEAVRAHAAAHGRDTAGPCWEIYGHARADPSESETEVFWLLR